MKVRHLLLVIRTLNGCMKRQGSLSGTCARESVDDSLSRVDRKWCVGQR